jgi:hypothetical protein
MNMSLVSVVCYQADVSATGRSLIQRSPIECGASEYDPETSVMTWHRPNRAVQTWKKIVT